MTDVKPATANERAEWKRLADAATKGPWIGYYNAETLKRNEARVDTTGEIISASPANAAFIAAARTSVPALEAALVQAEQEIDKQRRIRHSIELRLETVIAESRRNAEAFAERGCQVAALTDRCTALEQELKENEGVIAVWRGRTQRAEQALETIDKHNRHHEDHMAGANEYTRAIRIAVVGARHPEYTNPHIGTTLDAFLESDRIKGEVEEIAAMRVALANVSGALCDSGVVVPEDVQKYGEAVREIVKQRDAARELTTAERESAANAERRNSETRRDYNELQARHEANAAELRQRDEEIARLKGEAAEARDSRDSAHIDAEEEIAAHAATKAKLGRAVVALRAVRNHGIPSGTLSELQARIDAILADVDIAADVETWTTEKRELMRTGFAIARDNAEVSEHDGWQRTSPFVDWTVADKELDKALAKVDAPSGKPTCPKCNGTTKIDAGVCSQPGGNGFHDCSCKRGDS